MKNNLSREKSQIECVDRYDIASEISNLPAEAQREFLKALGNYAIFVPEYDQPKYDIDGEEIAYGRTRRADLDLRTLTRDRNGLKFSEKKILANIIHITLRMRAKVQQLHSNEAWLNRLETHEINEDIRLAREEEKAARLGRHPGDLRKLMRQRFVASSPESFEAAPRTRHKMVEEMMVAPTERLIFKQDCEEVKKGDLSGLIIDPEKISATLLRNLGLDEFIPSKKSPYPEKLAAQAEAAQRIKAALNGLTPLMLGDRGPMLDRYMRTFASEDGYVVGTTDTVNGKQLFRADLVDARNRIIHIHEGYEDEIPRLIKIRQVVRGVDKKVGEEWSKVRDVEELGKIKAGFAELVGNLWLVNNKFKVQIRELLMECLTLESTFKRKIRGDDGRMREEIVTRPNPGAKRAKWNLVPEKIDQRLREISRIERYLAEDEVRIQAYKAEHDRIPFGEMYLYIGQRAEENRGKKGSRILPENECQELKKKMAEWKVRFVPPKNEMGFLEPYRSFADKVVSAIESTEEKLTKTAVSRKEIADAVLKLFLVLKLQTFWTQIQTIYDDHLASRNLPYFIEVRDELVTLFKLLRDKKIAGQVKTPHFDGVYHVLYKLLGALINLAQEGRISSREKDKQAAWKIKDQMHKLVADTDIVKMVKSLKI
jgi:hypothetical protein